MPTCEELGICLVPYNPPGRGYLTGNVDEYTTFDRSDIRSRNPRFTTEAIKTNRGVIELLEKIGTEKDATLAHVAMTWLLAKSSWIVPIPRSRKIERLVENLGAIAVVLTPVDIGNIEDGMKQNKVTGDRY